MKINELVTRRPVTVDTDVTVERAAREMAEHGVGCLVVTEHGRIVGIVTDRDLVVRALARSLPADARVDSVMSMNVVSVESSSDVRDVVRTFGSHAVRRLPVVTGDEVTGVVSLDDLRASLTAQMGELTRGPNAQLLFPHAADPAPVPAVT